MSWAQRIRQEKLRTFREDYQKIRFAFIDLSFDFFAFFSNPYRVSRKFYQKKGLQNIYAYGETPYSTYRKIVKECGVSAEDTWLEVGAGRGKGCFWLVEQVGCQVIGVEWVGPFVFLAQWIKRFFRIKKVHFYKMDVEKQKLPHASFIYLYGLDPPIEQKGVRVLTISEPIEGKKVIKSFWVRFPWGRTRAFLHQF